MSNIPQIWSTLSLIPLNLPGNSEFCDCGIQISDGFEYKMTGLEPLICWRTCWFQKRRNYRRINCSWSGRSVSNSWRGLSSRLRNSQPNGRPKRMQVTWLESWSTEPAHFTLPVKLDGFQEIHKLSIDVNLTMAQSDWSRGPFVQKSSTLKNETFN